MVSDVIKTFASYIDIIIFLNFEKNGSYDERCWWQTGRGQVLVNSGFRFKKNKCTKEKITWPCFRKDCRSYLTTRKHDIDDVNAVITVLMVNVSYFLNCPFTVC